MKWPDADLATRPMTTIIVISLAVILWLILRVVIKALTHKPAAPTLAEKQESLSSGLTVNLYDIAGQVADRLASEEGLSPEQAEQVRSGLKTAIKEMKPFHVELVAPGSMGEDKTPEMRRAEFEEHLRFLKSMGEKRVMIVSDRTEGIPKTCWNADGQVYTIGKALRLSPLPHRRCPERCNCYYFPTG